MRFKKQKRHRKTVRFYTACFGFREPFKVLCDGTFIHHLLANNLSPQKSVSNTLGGDVQLFTSRCVIEELKSLGSSHAESFHAARKECKLARCEHEGNKSALDCIIETIGKNNSEHFFVATQDVDLRKRFQKVPGVPVLFGLRNALFLEQLSSFQREFVKSAEEQRLRATDLDRKILQKRAETILKSEEEGDASIVGTGAGDEVARDQVSVNKRRDRNRMEVKDKVQFKRKRPKGPNPLSCKKKKNHGSSNPKPEKDDKTGGSAQRNRPRRRKRSRKAKTSSGTEVASS
ncbi:hypothetical protein Cgig2_002009 [Carnegiea gigantea]|uniref:UTP23 sensor motif region domain-containing protein n=1 Tax=Carnegiea gigantea TaxID=171969 RepID=A0A9Q1Q4G4_9CARY|nr:hypothetical protein Cgig2_002009 [Carnegiea gigantea]